MENGWLTMVTSLELFGLMPFLVRAAYSSHWLPQHQTPTFLLRMPAIVVVLLVFHVSSVIPDRVKTWAMLTRFPPVSRVASKLGSQSMPNSAWPLWTTCSGVMSGPPGLIVTFRHWSS